jgi:hypothetical protein
LVVWVILFSTGEMGWWSPMSTFYWGFINIKLSLNIPNAMEHIFQISVSYGIHSTFSGYSFSRCQHIFNHS